MRMLASALVLSFALATPVVAQHAGHDAHAGHAAALATAQGVGVVKALNPAAGTVTLDHEAIKALNRGAMTMSFKVADATLLKGLAVGAKVSFTVKGQQIVAIRRI